MTDADHPTDTTARVGFIGKRLGRFLIIEELGRGGMATVYRGRDPALGRDVAIKVMHGFFAGRPELEARFRREANAVATIRHPSILNVFDFAPPAGEEPGYIVSELIEGPGLRAVLDAHGGKLQPEVAALVVARVAEALGAAHAAGIVHRDVKPDNVMIDRANGAARIVLTDFGVAHVSGMDTMTATGAVLGSPAYMSPEQARSEDVGATSDVFSLGVTLYQLCTGHLPFGGKDPLAVITAILRGQYRRPSEIEPKVGPLMEQVIVRCLQTAPAARFANAGEVAAALRESTAPVRQAVGLGDEAAALARFLNEGAAFEAALAPAVARVALVAGEEARRRGQAARALAEVGRALAYVPDDPAARALLDRIGSGQRLRSWRARGAAVAGALLLAGGATLAWRAAEERRHAGTTTARPVTRAADPRAGAEPPLHTAAPAATGAAGVGPTPEPVPLAVSAAVAAPTLPAPAGPSRASGSKSPVRTRANRGAAARTDEGNVVRSAARPASPAAGEAATRPAPSTAADPVAPATPPGRGDEKSVAEPKPPTNADAPAPPVEVRRASLVLRASYGFCEPSLDAQPPSLRANYNDLSPGRHDIYCTLPQGGPKVHVTTYELRPGAKASLVIVPGPQGRPIIGRTEWP